MLYFIYLSPHQSNNNLIKIKSYITIDKIQPIRQHCCTLKKLRRSTRVKSKPKYYHLELTN